MPGVVYPGCYGGCPWVQGGHGCQVCVNSTATVGILKKDTNPAWLLLDSCISLVGSYNNAWIRRRPSLKARYIIFGTNEIPTNREIGRLTRVEIRRFILGF